MLAYQQGLEDAVLTDGFRELPQWLGIEPRAHLLAGWPDLIDRDHLGHQGLAVA
jgi:hypothetical protein